ncbi:diguanylate cyclase [Aeromonas sobria]|uniref:diguanylate cyclase n=1 Tax=Aeromonas sobria TaxID=646 RepID=UPI00111B0ABA|nr:diguanylate cyclase [Aeromonas sobria]TNH91254.1 diguanylate cyclase response regulator [Aeromonas sobria]
MTKILLVEDSQTISRMLAQAIRKSLNLELDAVYTLAECLAKPHQDYFIALVDLTLPDAPNGEAARELLARHVPVIILTANLNEESRKYWLEQGALDYIIKDSRFSAQYTVSMVRRLSNNRNLEVMVVDDSILSRHYIANHLRRQLLTVWEAESGQQALDLLKEHPAIRLIVTDYLMPHMDGIELVRRLRDQFDKQSLAILGLSSSEDKTLSARFIKLGANDFLSKPFTPEELYCRVGHNLETLELMDTIRDTANRDYLTNLYNRRFLFENGNKWLQEQPKLTACLLDIDHFKRVNDHYGHHVGDNVLKLVAQQLGEFFKGDLVARLGGEEFCILSKRPDFYGLINQLEQFRLAISELAIAFEETFFSITISFGVTNMESDELGVLLSHADQLLYKAKHAGRNCIMQYEHQ